jgi:hypothetical protein
LESQNERNSGNFEQVKFQNLRTSGISISWNHHNLRTSWPWAERLEAGLCYSRSSIVWKESSWEAPS